MIMIDSCGTVHLRSIKPVRRTVHTQEYFQSNLTSRQETTNSQSSPLSTHEHSPNFTHINTKTYLNI